MLIVITINNGNCQTNLIPQRNHYYSLTTQDEFDSFITSLNNGNVFDGDTIVLNVNVSGEYINSTDRTFSGTFLGSNHKISNLSHVFVSTLNGTIDSLIIDETSQISGTVDVSSFAIKNYGSIKNCSNYADIIGNTSGSNYMHIGGICSISYGNIINCKNYGNISASLNGQEKVVVRCGGITSFQEGKLLLACENFGDINASAYYYVLCGGINADQQGGQLVGCKNHGAVNSTVIGASSNGNASSGDIIHYTGGIVGQAQVGALMDKCINFGSISNNTQYVGGIAGQVSNTDMYNLINYGRIESVQGKYYSCAAGISGYSHAVNTSRQIYNCINHGDIVSYSQYGIATAAGCCPDIVNYSIANIFNSGNVSANSVGGTGTQSFEIPDYKFSNSVELCKVENLEQVNLFVESDNSSKVQLLKWIQDDSIYSLCDIFCSYAETLHGSVNLYIFLDENNTSYNVNVIDDITGKQHTIQGESPIRITHLQPETKYKYVIYGINNQNYDKGFFTTLTPNIIISSNVGYDKIYINQFCDAKGIDNFDANLSLYSDNKKIKSLEVNDSTIVINDLDEETEYTVEILYTLNGKDFKSGKITAKTMSIIPQFRLISNSPYSLTLKCNNYTDIKKFNPRLYLENPKYYKFGGFIDGESRVYELDQNGQVTIDSLYYGYSHQLSSIYTIKEETRCRDVQTYTTSHWGGEGIIQLSPNAAMIHGIFGRMGERVPGLNSSCLYNRASFSYRDATSSDEYSNYRTDGTCIDNRFDYATTIPINSSLYQYYIDLWYDRSQYGKYPSITGSWQVIDARNKTVDVVEPRFFNMRFENSVLYCSFIQGEEYVLNKILEYKVEGMDSFNEINLSQSGGSEILQRTMTSIVPQLTYLLRISCKTNNGKIYSSPMCRLNNGILQLATDIASIENVKVEEINISTIGNNIIINNKNPNELVSIYNISGLCIYKGTKSDVYISDKGLYIVSCRNLTFKIKI